MTTSSGDDPGRGARPPATSGLHPGVYTLLILFCVWFALAVWSFAGAGVTDYLLVVVSGFIGVVVALQLILSRVGHAQRSSEESGDQPSWQDWMAMDFETWQDRLSGAQAALHILLPIAAAAVGMTAFGILFHIAERGSV